MPAPGKSKMDAKFWKSAGLHLVERNDRGWLAATPDLVRAYLTRPEVHPIDTSCANEIALFESLMDDPFLAVADERLATLEDRDAADNYRVVLGFRGLYRDAAAAATPCMAKSLGGDT